jgi:hypothetical protein
VGFLSALCDISSRTLRLYSLAGKALNRKGREEKHRKGRKEELHFS